MIILFGIYVSSVIINLIAFSIVLFDDYSLKSLDFGIVLKASACVIIPVINTFITLLMIVLAVSLFLDYKGTTKNV